MHPGPFWAEGAFWKGGLGRPRWERQEVSGQDAAGMEKGSLQEHHCPQPTCNAGVQACTHVSGRVFVHVCMRKPGVATTPLSSLPSASP